MAFADLVIEAGRSVAFHAPVFWRRADNDNAADGAAPSSRGLRSRRAVVPAGQSPAPSPTPGGVSQC